MPPFASEQSHAITSADPESVWDVLTATGVPLDYLHGMTAESDWQPGATVTMPQAEHVSQQGLRGGRRTAPGRRPGRLRLRGRGIDSLVRAPLHYRRDDVTVVRQDFGPIEEGCAATHVRK